MNRIARTAAASELLGKARMEGLSLGDALVAAPVRWEDFPVTPEAHAYFLLADADKDGQVGRADAKSFFLRTGVPGPLLAKVRAR